MTDNEKLIEEAAKAIWDADTTIPETWDNKSVVEWDRNTYRGMARAALGVFEKAHTPTDDEREALARRAIRAADEADECGDPVIEAWSDGERFTSDDLRALAAGFRRTEVPEPSAEAWLIYEVEGDCMTCRPEVIGVALSEEAAARIVSDADMYRPRHSKKVEALS